MFFIMKGFCFTFFITIACSVSGFCQKLDADKYKPWSRSDTLKWQDYNISNAIDSSLPHGLQAKALTSLVYFYVPSIWHPDSCMNVLVAVRKKYSYTLDTINTYLLKHERIHFDIAELYARQLREALLNLSQEEDYQLDQYLTMRDSMFQISNHYQDL